jgi:hypothetical protein
MKRSVQQRARCWVLEELDRIARREAIRSNEAEQSAPLIGAGVGAVTRMRATL